MRALAAPVPDRCALVAVGGYGRRQLAPGSDFDLLFVHEASADASAVERLANSVLYPLWNAGFRVSHATLTPEECGARAAHDLASLTAGLDARVVCGSPALATGVRGASISVARRDPERVVDLLAASRRERAERFGNLGTALEPDLRDSLGGLRDIQVLGWCHDLGVAPPNPHPGSRPDPPVSGFDPAAATAEALDFLLLVRHALQRATGGSSNRLGVDVHETVAEALGIGGRRGWEPRDEVVREVAGRGRWVQLLFAVATGIWPSLVAAARRLDPGAARFDPGQPDPAGLVAWAGSLGAATWPERRAWMAWMLAEPPEMLEALDASGLTEALIPEWADVRARPQRDPYHRSHVDAHLLASLRETHRLLTDPPDGISALAVTRVRDRQALLLGALLHDIGKVGTGSHVERGVRIAEQVTERMGLPSARREAVVFLIREHLLLSDSATRRNLDDEDLILRIAGAIGDRDRLGMLTVLTLADAFATGPAASSPWRLALIFELVAKVGRAFDHHQMDADRGMRLSVAERSLRATLSPEDAGEVESFLASVPPAYLLWAPPERAPIHLRLVRPPFGDDEARVHVGESAQEGFHELTIAARDRPGLLAMVAGSLTLAGLSILTARAFTTREAIALDSFHVRGAFETPIDPYRWRRFEDALQGALRGDLDLEERVAALRAHYRSPPSSAPVSARMVQERSDFFSVVEVQAPDRLGLLFDLAMVLARRSLDVHFARVATYGPRVVDVFYLSDREGERVDDPATLDVVCRELEGAAAEGRPGSGLRSDAGDLRRRRA